MPFRPVIWIPDMGTRTQRSPLFHRKEPPFWHPLILVATGLLGSMADSCCDGDKAPQSSGNGCQGRQNVWGGTDCRYPRQNVSLKAAVIWWLTGGYMFHCISPCGAGGLWGLVCVTMNVSPDDSLLQAECRMGISAIVKLPFYTCRGS